MKPVFPMTIVPMDKVFFLTVILVLEKARKLIANNEQRYTCHALGALGEKTEYRLEITRWIKKYIAFLLYDVKSKCNCSSLETWYTLTQNVWIQSHQRKEYRLAWIDHMISVFKNYIALQDAPIFQTLKERVKDESELIQIVLQIAIVKTMQENGTFKGWYDWNRPRIGVLFHWEESVQGYDYWWNLCVKYWK